MEKPIDFWLRKGKAVGETMPTERGAKVNSEDSLFSKREGGRGDYANRERCESKFGGFLVLLKIK